METSKISVVGINQGVECKLRDRNSTKPSSKNERFFVKVKDENGKEYEIRYFF
jgi:hypothetical protein